MWDIDYLANTRARDISQYLLGYYEKDCSAVSIDCSHTSDDAIKQIMSLKNKGTVIGVQFNTAHHTNHYPRNYPKNLAKEYAQMCKKSGYSVVNLTGGYDLGADMDCGDIDILAMPGIIKMLDIVVTIDSFSGHLAGCFNIPCIVLFKEVYAYTMEVLRNNLNLVSKTSHIRSILPEHIFKYTTDIISGEIELPQNIKEEYNILNESNTVML